VAGRCGAGRRNAAVRDVEGVSAKVAYLQSIGANPTDFRIYKTVDGGATWTMQFQNQNPGAFYDCFAFWTPNRGISHSDSVDGVFPNLRTTDGVTWLDISSNMPPALPGEGAFAASGTCVATQGGRTLDRDRCFHDRESAGDEGRRRHLGGLRHAAREFAERGRLHGGLPQSVERHRGGGDLDPSFPNNAATATSSDGGATWTLTNAPPVTGAIFGLAYAQGAGNGSRTVVITANAGGAAWTPDEGDSWYSLPGVTGYWPWRLRARRPDGWWAPTAASSRSASDPHADVVPEPSAACAEASAPLPLAVRPNATGSLYSRPRRDRIAGARPAKLLPAISPWPVDSGAGRV